MVGFFRLPYLWLRMSGLYLVKIKQYGQGIATHRLLNIAKQCVAKPHTLRRLFFRLPIGLRQPENLYFAFLNASAAWLATVCN